MISYENVHEYRLPIPDSQRKNSLLEGIAYTKHSSELKQTF